MKIAKTTSKSDSIKMDRLLQNTLICVINGSSDAAAQYARELARYGQANLLARVMAKSLFDLMSGKRTIDSTPRSA